MQVQSVMAGAARETPFENGIPINTEPINFSAEKTQGITKAIRYEKQINPIITDRELTQPPGPSKIKATNIEIPKLNIEDDIIE